MNKFFKIKFTSRNMFGSIGHTIAELDYYFKLVHEYKIKKYNIIFLSNKNKMAHEAYKLFSKYFFAGIISDKLDYIIKKFFLNEPNDLGLDFGLNTIKHGHKSGNYTLEFVFKKYIDYYKLRSKINNFNPFKEISFSKDLKQFLENEIGNSKYIVIQIKEEKGNATILKTDPNSYVNFIKFFQQKKYKVIFAGRREKIPHEFKDLGVVDYSKFDNASLQTDLNLISKSELVVSGASGFACLAQVNDVPCVYSNSWHIVLSPSSKYCIHLPYLFSRKNQKQLVPYDEIINLYLNQYNQTFFGEDQYDVIPNTGSDILQACKEAMMLKEKYTEPTDIYLNFKNRYDGVPIKYCENRISDSFVNKYAKLF